MTPFHQQAVLLIVLWLALVAVRFRRSTPILVGGLVAVGLLTLAALARGGVSASALGLGPPRSWLATLAFALAGLAVMLAASPLADRLATGWFAKPPTLGAFRGLQQSRLKLIAGVVVAWILGGVLEELAFRGVLLQAVQALAATRVAAPLAAAVAIAAAAGGAGIIHLYQGPRAAVIITQLSALFGLLFVVSGRNLWAVILCHGLYDTVAFVRFARGTSRYANLDRDS
jgi:hypothetical protein